MLEEHDIPKQASSEEAAPGTNHHDSTTRQSENQLVHMEVHHHLQVEKKNFKKYFLELLMIFLAVTMGFFAESLREHLADNSKEKQYIKSMIADLKNDTAMPEDVIDNNIKRVSGIDTLSSLLNSTLITYADEKRLYIFNSHYVSNVASRVWNDATISQLLTSGDIWLISGQGRSDSIMNYYGPHKDVDSGHADILSESVKHAYFASEDILDKSFIK